MKNRIAPLSLLAAAGVGGRYPERGSVKKAKHWSWTNEPIGEISVIVSFGRQ